MPTPFRVLSRTPARNVRGPGYVDLIPAVEILATPHAAGRCCYCGKGIGAEGITSHRTGDAEGLFDVRYCSVEHRAAAVR